MNIENTRDEIVVVAVSPFGTQNDFIYIDMGAGTYDQHYNYMSVPHISYGGVPPFFDMNFYLKLISSKLARSLSHSYTAFPLLKS